MRRPAGWCLLLAALVLGAATPAVAGDKGLTDSETFSGFQFNFNNPGARSLGMGGALVLGLFARRRMSRSVRWSA